MDGISTQVLEKLRTFDTPTICNLVELFKIRPRNTGFMDHRIKANFPEMGPIVGYAATATFRSSGERLEGGDYGNIPTQVEKFGELSGPPIVVFQDLDDPPVGATFGEVMCSTYQAFGAVGLITSGGGRDLDQVREIGFPVFTSGTICAHGYCHIIDLHVPVHVGGLVVYPDDLLHADCNGVTSIPKEIADEIADAGDEFVAAEKLVLDVMQSGSPTMKDLHEARAASGEKMRKLKERIGVS